MELQGSHTTDGSKILPFHPRHDVESFLLSPPSDPTNFFPLAGNYLNLGKELWRLLRKAFGVPPHLSLDLTLCRLQGRTSRGLSLRCILLCLPQSLQTLSPLLLSLLPNLPPQAAQDLVRKRSCQGTDRGNLSLWEGIQSGAADIAAPAKAETFGSLASHLLKQRALFCQLLLQLPGLGRCRRGEKEPSGVLGTPKPQRKAENEA